MHSATAVILSRSADSQCVCQACLCRRLNVTHPWYTGPCTEIATAGDAPLSTSHRTLALFALVLWMTPPEVGAMPHVRNKAQITASARVIDVTLPRLVFDWAATIDTSRPATGLVRVSYRAAPDTRRLQMWVEYLAN